MTKQSYVSCGVSHLLGVMAVLALAACAQTPREKNNESFVIETPTVDYIEGIDVRSAKHKDSFLNQLAMNYRSYAIYNARTSGYPDMGELFAQKAVAAFSGEVPFPETMNNWPVDDDKVAYELSNAYNNMIELLKNDASEEFPELAAELQAKYDCWLSAYSSGQMKTADECRMRFNKTLEALRDCRGGKDVHTEFKREGGAANDTVTTTEKETIRGGVVVNKNVSLATGDTGVVNARRVGAGRRAAADGYYPETESFASVRRSPVSREGVVVVNNVNIPEHLINPVPVQPMVFNQNIYGGDKTVTNSNNVTNTDESIVHSGGADCQKNCPAGEDCGCNKTDDDTEEVEEIVIDADFVSRQEFVDMMLAMRQELATINARLAKLNGAPAEDETTIIKVQQIPLQPTQHVMEEVFEIRFDFNKSIIKPEYQDVIKKLVEATQNNKNIKVSVVGHTDTAGSKSYNYALGGRRAEAVQKMLIKYGIPSSQIVAVSAGEEDLKVPTPDGVPNAENRRVRVVKEVSYTEPADGQTVPVANVSVEEIEVPCDEN